ncbi:MAG: hypothetical protein KF759_01510 [Dokdonella sp.]|nr:hypothetical protein [Dokdonella sp.]
MRRADAGYEIAQACAREQGLKLPMLQAAACALARMERGGAGVRWRHGV